MMASIRSRFRSQSSEYRSCSSPAEATSGAGAGALVALRSCDQRDSIRGGWGWGAVGATVAPFLSATGVPACPLTGILDARPHRRGASSNRRRPSFLDPIIALLQVGVLHRAIQIDRIAVSLLELVEMQ